MNRQLSDMCQMQSIMNELVNEKWKTSNYPWYRAVWTECAELMDHYGWKWWKKQELDLEQVKLELVDIWHFGLSWAIDCGHHVEGIESYLKVGLQKDKQDFKECLEDFTEYTLSKKGFHFKRFGSLMKSIGMDFDELYQLYIAKNTLNIFRQYNGYNEGTYIKTWHGEEDNQVLMEIIDDVGYSYNRIMTELEYQYQTVLAV